MPSKPAQAVASEHVVNAMNGWMMLIVNLALLGGAIYVSSHAVAGSSIQVLGGLLV